MGFKFALRFLAVGLFSGALLMPAFAHHSTAEMYDLTKPTTFKGRVTGLVWVNPHAAILMEVRKTDGTTETWVIEVGAPSQLLSAGWKKSDLSVGAQITVTAFPMKSGAKTEKMWTVPKGYPPSEMMDLYKKAGELNGKGRMAHGSEITLANGKKLKYTDIWTKPLQ
jgi:hypothetical protein